jgi:hypothetical protein
MQERELTYDPGQPPITLVWRAHRLTTVLELHSRTVSLLVRAFTGTNLGHIAVYITMSRFQHLRCGEAFENLFL